MYIGTQPYSGIRARHTYTATAGQTSFSGAGAENVTLTYSDELYIDVYQNGVKLSPADYTATSGTTVVLGTGATVSDIVEVIKYDAFSVADTVSAKDGGGFGGNISTSGTLAVTGTSTLTGAITSSDGMTITTADNTNTLSLISTDADANTGPNLVLQRDSASPADNDLSGTIKFIADNDAGEATDCVSIFSKIIDASNGSEDASLLVNSIVGGSQISRFGITPTEIVLNDDSIDLDFRVESNGDANCLFVDGANDKVGIGTNAPQGFLSINKNADGSALPHIHLIDNSDAREAFITNNAGDLILGTMNSSDDTIDSSVTVLTSSMVFRTSGSDRASITTDGKLLVGTTNTSPATNDEVGISLDGGNNVVQISRNQSTALELNRKGNDGVVASIRQASTIEGNISVSGTTVTYGGGHLGRWSRLLDNSKDATILKGTVMTNLDEMVEWTTEDGIKEDNEQLNKMAVSSVEGDANVAGVFVNWDDDDDFKDMMIAMTGDMVIRIAQGTTVARGDLLMSAGDGTAKPQGDDIVRSKTIAKVTSTNVSHTYDDGTYLVPCVLMAC